jgi:ABC-2 type transport system permease protein
MNRMLAITKKELKAYFGSPMAALFIGAFLLAALFSFFWLETFFARNTADIRPLFRWMPVLMIFLVGSLTMRQWSEEQRMGTMEILLTLPVRLWQLVLGKFLAVLILVAVALALTLGLPITVSLLGPLDWGPVFGGYLGALLMASAYIAIGLYLSSRTDNQIVALILTVLVGGFLYILGSTGITNFMGNAMSDLFRALGTGSRFASIERGVIDLRDLLYYGSLTAFFLLLNILALDRKRWSFGANTSKYRRGLIIATVLIAANLLATNLWLNKVNGLRLDLTENREYSLSQTSRDLINNLGDPLILRGYFSEKTHPLLSPLVPRIKDLLQEYAIASNGRVKVDFVDPKYDPAQEAEANQQYGIKPVPFQVAGRYEASVVNSYFNILIKYGDQHIVLGFNDIIEVQPRADGQIDVRLRNLEYDLTKSIKKAVFGFQSLGTIFEKVKGDLALTAVISKANLPPELAKLPATISTVAQALTKESSGKLQYEAIDPSADPEKQAEVKKRFAIEPMQVSFFSQDTFYLYLLLTVGDKTERVYLTADMGEAEVRKEVESILKRTSSGFLKTIGLWTPPTEGPPEMAMMGQQPPKDNYRMIQKVLPENYNLTKVDLSSGRVPPDVDVLLLAAPQGMDDMARFAIDQYLMHGGAVVALAGNYLLDLNPYSQALAVKPVTAGIGDLLSHYGIKVEDTLVMDKQNEPFPIPVTRNLGGMTVQEIKQINYPFFVDVRQNGMAKDTPAVANLPAVTMNWVSPLTVDSKESGRKVVKLLESSSNSWTASATNIQPDFERYPEVGFAPGDSMAAQTLAVASQGVFDSYFADRPDPRVAAKAKKNKAEEDPGVKEESLEATAGKKGVPPYPDTQNKTKEPEKASLPDAPVIKKSAESSRLVVVGSAEFINDTVFSISQSMSQDRFMNSLSFLQNLIDWSVEDEELLVIRSRGTYARLLMPLSRPQQTFWEWLNYGAALLALLVVSLYGGLRQRKERPLISA